MGIADYGLSNESEKGMFDYYSYSTPEILGRIGIYSLHTLGAEGVGSDISIQLNAMLSFENSGKKYDYWIQDIAFMQTSKNYISFQNNIWNSTWPGAGIYASTLLGNGTAFESKDTASYYEDISQLPGSGVELNYPSSIYLEVVSFESLTGQPSVSFRYNDGFGWQTYDTVTFVFAHPSSDRGFVVNGNSQTPARQDFDAELVLGGPSSYANTVDLSSRVYLQLYYWNGHNLQMIKNAFDFGSDTSETISNVTISLGHFENNGSLYANLTDGHGDLTEIYDYQNISLLTVSGFFSGGSAVVNGQRYYFKNGNLSLTLWPGNYSIGIGTSFLDVTSYWNTTVTTLSGKSTSISPPTLAPVYIPEIVFTAIVIAGVSAVVLLSVRRYRKRLI